MVLDFIILTLLFTIADGIWIGIVAKKFYKNKLKEFLRPTPRWAAVAIFYLIYISGLYSLALRPALDTHDVWSGLWHGAAVGLIAYATYGLTNLATFKNWPVLLVFCDFIWGIVLSSGSVFLAYTLVDN